MLPDIYYRDHSKFEYPYPSLLDRVKDIYSRYKAQALALVPPKLKILDISRYQKGELVDLAAIAANGVKGFIIQASYGTTIEPEFKNFWPRLLDAGFWIATYHFFYGTLSGKNQAEVHLESVRPLWEAMKGKPPIFSDVEKYDTASVSTRISYHQSFLSTAQGAGARVGTYSSYKCWKDLMGDTKLAPNVIEWVAHWTWLENFTIPVNWVREQVLFHQKGVAKVHSWVPAIPGITGDVDVNDFFGTEQDLSNLVVWDAPVPSKKDEILAHIDSVTRNLADSVNELGVIQEKVLEL